MSETYNICKCCGLEQCGSSSNFRRNRTHYFCASCGSTDVYFDGMGKGIPNGFWKNMNTGEIVPDWRNK